MTKLILEDSKMPFEKDFHDQIAAHPETPNFYGRNLDAMYDILTSFYVSPINIVWNNSDKAKLALGNRFNSILDAFADAEEE